MSPRMSYPPAEAAARPVTLPARSGAQGAGGHMATKRAWVVAMLALGACVDPSDVVVWKTFSPDDPRVGSYRGAFDGCLKTVGNASLSIDSEGGVYFNTAFDGVE